MTITYVNTSAQDTLSYPFVLRVTFTQVPWFSLLSTPDSINLANDIQTLTNNMDAGGYPVAMASDPTVAPGALSVTIDFAPLDPTSATPVSQILTALSAGLLGSFALSSNTSITQVEKVNAATATGVAGAAARGATALTVQKNQQDTSLGAQLAAFLGKAENVLLIGAGVAALFYFAPEIKVALRGLMGRRKGTA